MERSSESQHSLIERYVSGLMSSEEALAFEAFILTKPDWLKKVNRARTLFDEIYEQEWASEIDQTLAREKDKSQVNGKQPRSKRLSQWSFQLFPSMLTMAFGAFLMFILLPQSSQPVLGKIHYEVVSSTRNLSKSHHNEVIVFDKDVDTIAFKLPVGDDISKVYDIKLVAGSVESVNQGYKPDEQGKVLFTIARRTIHDELITISILNNADGTVFKEYRFILKEN